MRKFFIFLLAVSFCVLLCSCGVPDVKTLSKVLSDPYEAQIAVNDKDNVYTAAVTYDGYSLSLVFSEPDLLCGITYGFKDGKSYIVYNDLNIPFEPGNKKDGISGGVLIWKKLLSADGEYTVRRAGEQYIMTDGKTEYRFDKETKIPVFIKSGDITITFTDFRAKNDQTS